MILPHADLKDIKDTDLKIADEKVFITKEDKEYTIKRYNDKLRQVWKELGYES